MSMIVDRINRATETEKQLQKHLQCRLCVRKDGGVRVQEGQSNQLQAT